MERERFMAPGARRRLTDAERGLAAEVFGAGLDAGRIRIFALPLWNRAFVASGRLVCWPARTARLDFAGPATPLRQQGMFVHELVHAWQAQHGVNLPWAKLRAGDGARAYAYDLEADGPFAGLNIEQQAMVVEHAFLAARGEAAPFAPGAYAVALAGPALPLADALRDAA